MYWLTMLKQLYLLCKDPPKLTTQSTTVLPPVTPEHLHNGIKIALPITPVHHPTTTITHPESRLILWLMHSPYDWATSLWHQIWPHANLYTLHKTLGQGCTIFIVSNTSVNHRGNRMMAWIIHSNTKLCSGKGIVPGPINEMFSGLAKAYRVLTALSFLQHYINQFPQTFQKPPWIYLYCNNLGVITQINNETKYLVQPNQTIHDEYGIYQTIKEIAQSPLPANIKFAHVLGHQYNQTKKKPLMLKEWLNIECDTVATKLHSQLIPTNYPKHHLFIACACPYWQNSNQNNNANNVSTLMK